MKADLTNDLAKIISLLQNKADKKQAAILQRFFKTGPGEYGEGDIFWGVKVPELRQIALQCGQLSYQDLRKLLKSPVHEKRTLAVLILVSKYQHAQDCAEKSKIVNFYKQNLKAINNWDLVDLSAPNILGNFMFHCLSRAQTKVQLLELASDPNVWSRRIATVSILYFIRQGRSVELFYLVKKLSSDGHDLIHKAMGWMLRELGKKVDRALLLKFLDENFHILPRTTLRYAIEHLSGDLRLHYLKKR